MNLTLVATSNAFAAARSGSHDDSAFASHPSIDGIFEDMIDNLARLPTASRPQEEEEPRRSNNDEERRSPLRPFPSRRRSVDCGELLANARTMGPEEYGPLLLRMNRIDEIANRNEGGGAHRNVPSSASAESPPPSSSSTKKFVQGQENSACPGGREFASSFPAKDDKGYNAPTSRVRSRRHSTEGPLSPFKALQLQHQHHRHHPSKQRRNAKRQGQKHKSACRASEERAVVAPPSPIRQAAGSPSSTATKTTMASSTSEEFSLSSVVSASISPGAETGSTCRGKLPPPPAPRPLAMRTDRCEDPKTVGSSPGECVANYARSSPASPSGFLFSNRLRKKKPPSPQKQERHNNSNGETMTVKRRSRRHSMEGPMPPFEALQLQQQPKTPLPQKQERHNNSNGETMTVRRRSRRHSMEGPMPPFEVLQLRQQPKRQQQKSRAHEFFKRPLAEVATPPLDRNGDGGVLRSFASPVTEKGSTSSRNNTPPPRPSAENLKQRRRRTTNVECVSPAAFIGTKKKKDKNHEKKKPPRHAVVPEFTTAPRSSDEDAPAKATASGGLRGSRSRNDAHPRSAGGASSSRGAPPRRTPPKNAPPPEKSRSSAVLFEETGRQSGRVVVVPSPPPGGRRGSQGGRLRTSQRAVGGSKQDNTASRRRRKGPRRTPRVNDGGGYRSSPREMREKAGNGGVSRGCDAKEGSTQAPRRNGIVSAKSDDDAASFLEGGACSSTILHGTDARLVSCDGRVHCSIANRGGLGDSTSTLGNSTRLENYYSPIETFAVDVGSGRCDVGDGDMSLGSMENVGQFKETKEFDDVSPLGVEDLIEDKSAPLGSNGIQGACVSSSRRASIQVPWLPDTPGGAFGARQTSKRDVHGRIAAQCPQRSYPLGAGALEVLRERLGARHGFRRTRRFSECDPMSVEVVFDEDSWEMVRNDLEARRDVDGRPIVASRESRVGGNASEGVELARPGEAENSAALKRLLREHEAFLSNVEERYSGDDR